MMKRPSLSLAAFLCALALLPANPLGAQTLKLIPAPQEIQARDGRFVITPKTQIVMEAKHSAEDRLAAETLAEEIESAGGPKVAIVPATVEPKGPGRIHLARVSPGKNSKALSVEEGYVLVVDGNHVRVASTAAPGIFYGVQTLRQMLRRGDDGRLFFPTVSISDWPAMRWRGVHDDISRGPVPTLDYMKKQIRTLAEYKINLFSLYIEHVFDYRENPLIGPKDGALTAAETKELVEYAKRYFVTLLPEQQAFGHLHHVLKNEIYSDLGETPHGHVLAPVNEKSYDLIRSLYAELVPLFPGPLFHIGSDETFELGRGQSQARAKEIGLGRVYLEHLRRVAEIMKPYNKRLLFWHDVAAHYPELLNILPKEMVPVIWRYDPAPNFEAAIQPFRNAGFEIFVSPGASNWNRIFPDLETAYVNIRNLVRDGQKFSALGTLNTTWDDDGEALFSMTWPALVFGAAAAWQPGETSIDTFKANYDWAFYRNESSEFREALDNLSRAHALMAISGLGGASDDFYWMDPFSELGARTLGKALPIAGEMRLAAERALEALYRHRSRARAHADTLEALLFAARRLDALGMKIQFAAEIGDFYWDAYRNQSDRGRVGHDLNEITSMNGRLEDLRDSTTQLRTAYSKLWLQENRPHWLGNVTIRYDYLASLYQSKIQALKEAARMYGEKGELPPPEQLGFYLRTQK